MYFSLKEQNCWFMICQTISSEAIIEGEGSGVFRCSGKRIARLCPVIRELGFWLSNFQKVCAKFNRNFAASSTTSTAKALVDPLVKRNLTIDS